MKNETCQINSVILPDGVPDKIQLIPVPGDGGIITGYDGRVFSMASASEVAANSLRQGIDIPVDFGHRSEWDSSARAAGWIKELITEKDGSVWGRTEWTESGKNAVAAKEYRYISPAFSCHQRKDGIFEINKITSAALCVRPNLTLKGLNTQQKNDMSNKNEAETTPESAAPASGITEERIAGLEKKIEELMRTVSGISGKDKTETNTAGKKPEDKTDAGTAGASDMQADAALVKRIEDLEAERKNAQKELTRQIVANAVKAGKIPPAGTEALLKLTDGKTPGEAEAFIATLVPVLNTQQSWVPPDDTARKELEAKIREYMPIINAAVLAGLNTRFSNEFAKGLSSPSPQFAKTATVMLSDADGTKYGWLNVPNGMREWVSGSREPRSIKADGYEIINKKYENTVEVARTSIEDDKNCANIYAPLVRMMGESCIEEQDRQVFTLLKNAASVPCFDGQNFVDSHPVYPNADETGTAEMVSNRIGTGTSGEFWCILQTNRAVKPVIFQQRTKPELTAKVREDSDSVFDRDVYSWGAYYRFGVGCSFWQFIQGSNDELSEASLEKGIAQMRKLKANGGTPLNVNPNLMVVGPANEGKARNLLEAVNNAAGATNIWYKRLELVVTPYFA
ncbi:hypothetical protein CHS0354_006813 [Potamilus streckersoni]|uniref:Bacteriophage Mu GpT domain-containing protein n=1 Tax=Potamilus streckersoni TaxID=2493646 RepID=A0AAE0TE78_9BIVA|nr:hypothetical protein CHS0354_006813 [Potamilus streckersoni]